jgi:predicted RNA-binding Zn-ribbon protein involved in translation (DUF1610 family)
MQKLQDEIERRKALAIKNRARPNRMMFACFMVGFFLSVLGILAFDTPPKGTFLSGVIASVLLGSVLARRAPAHSARCPACGMSWEMVGASPPNVLTWTSCPGCGLKISADDAPRDQTTVVACYRCNEVIDRKEAVTMWRLPLLIMKLAHMVPQNEADQRFCRSCVRGLNLFVCLLALMGIVAAFLNPWPHFTTALLVSAVSIAIWFSAGAQRRKRRQGNRSSGP